MRTFIMLFISIFTVSCNSNKMMFQENPPFQIEEVNFQKWFGGTQEAGSGIHFKLIFSEISENVLVEQVFFRGKEEPLKQNSQNPKEFFATFTNQPKKDVILDSNPIKEIDNPRPSLTSEIPFELQPNEAVIQYLKGNKHYYYKVQNMSEKEVIAYPSSGQLEN